MLEPGDVPIAIAASPGGGVWFTIDSANAIGRVRNGKMERFVEEKTNGEPIGIAAAVDGSAWYTDAPAGQITHILPDGEVHSVSLDRPLARIGQIAIAPDGAVWFTEASAYSVTRLKDGTFERHVIDRIRGVALGVAVSGDGMVWATLQAANQLLRIALDGSMQTFDIPTRGSSPSEVAVDKDGAVWFLEFRGNKIGRFAGGRFDEFPMGTEHAGLTGLALASRRRSLVRNAAQGQPRAPQGRQAGGVPAAAEGGPPLQRRRRSRWQRLVHGYPWVRGDAEGG